MTELLRDFWYLAIVGQAIAPGQTRPLTLLGEQVLVGRRTDGQVFAFGDACPHRGMPMRHGSFDGVRLRCAMLRPASIHSGPAVPVTSVSSVSNQSSVDCCRAGSSQMCGKRPPGRSLGVFDLCFDWESGAWSLVVHD